MITCPNKNLESWKQLEQAVGETTAYVLWNEYEGDTLPLQLAIEDSKAVAYYDNNGKVVFKKGASLTPEIVIHEFAHPFVDALVRDNNTLFKKLVKDIADTEPGREIVQYVQDNYGDKDSLTKNKEVLVRAIAMAGKKYIDPKTGTGLLAAVQRFLKFVNDLVNKTLQRKIRNKETLTVADFDINTKVVDIAKVLTMYEGKIDLSPLATPTAVEAPVFEGIGVEDPDFLDSFNALVEESNQEIKPAIVPVIQPKKEIELDDNIEKGLDNIEVDAGESMFSLSAPEKSSRRIENIKELNSALSFVPKAIRGEIIDSLVETMSKGNKAVGRFKNAMITISAYAPSGTAYHEAFHAIFRTALSTDEQAAILKDARKLYTKPTSTELGLLARTTGITNTEELVSLHYEEKLADDFKNYRLNSSDATYSIPEYSRVKKFFRTIFNMIRGLFSSKARVSNLFEKISTGGFVNREVNANPILRNDSYKLLEHPVFSNEEVKDITNSLIFIGFAKTQTIGQLENIDFSLIKQQLLIQRDNLKKQNTPDSLEKAKAISSLFNDKLEIDEFWKTQIENTLKDNFNIKRKTSRPDKASLEDNEDNTLLDEIETSGFYKSSWEVSGATSATTATKFLFSNILDIKSVNPVTGKKEYNSFNALGLPKVLDYGVVWSRVEESVSDIVPTFNQETGVYNDNLVLMLNKLANDAKVHPFFYDLINKINGIDNKAKGELVFTLSKRLANYIDVLIDVNDDNSIHKFSILDAAQEKVEKYVADTWATNFSELIKAEAENNTKVFSKSFIDKVDSTKNYIINLSMDVAKEKATYNDGLEILSGLLKDIGIHITTPALDFAIITNYKKAGSTNESAFYDLSRKLNSAITFQLDKIKKLKNYKEDIAESFILDEEVFRKHLASAVGKFSPVPGERMILGPDGKQIWLGQSNNMSSKMLNQIKMGDLTPISKFEKSPYHGNSLFINLLKDNDSDFRNVLKIVNLNNNRLDISTDKGTSFKDLEMQDQFMSAVNMTLKGYLFGLAEADKTQQNLLYIGKKNLFNSGVTYKGNGEFQFSDSNKARKIAKYFMGAFADELNRMQVAWEQVYGENPLPENELIPYYHYYDTKVGRQPGGAFRSFLFPFVDLVDMGLQEEADGDIPGKLKPFTVETLLKNDKLRTAVSDALKKQISTDLKFAIKNGVVAVKNNEIVNLTLDVTEVEGREFGAVEAIADYTINSIIGNIEQIKLFNQDPALYKVKFTLGENNKIDWANSGHFSDFMKRIPATYASGKDAWLKEGLPQIYTSSTVSNIEGMPGVWFAEFDENNKPVFNEKNIDKIASSVFPEATTEEEKEEAIAKVKQILKPYLDVNITDAQAWITLDAYKTRMDMYGKWSPAHEAAYIKINNNEVLDFNEIALMAQPLKTVHVEQITLPNGIVSLQYNKQSEAVLQPQIVEALEINNLYQAMKKQGVDHVIVWDGKKVGAVGVTPITDERGKILKSEDIKFNSLPLSYNYLFLQQDLTPHGISNKALVGSQPVKVALSVLLEDETYADKYTADEILSFYHQTVSRLSDLGLVELEKNLGIADNKFTKVDGEYKFNKFLASELEGTVPYVYTEAIKNGMPIESLPIARRIKSKFNALFTKATVKLKQKGGAMVQLSPLGFVGFNTTVSKSVKDGIIWMQNPESELKPMRIENGKVKPAQVLLPYTQMLELIKEAFPTSYKDMSKEDIKNYVSSGALQGLSYRIPNQGPSSNDIFEIAGFLPPEMGDTIIAYSSITKKTGSDYDIDKAFIMLPNLVFNKATQKIEMVKFDLANIENAPLKSAQNARFYLMKLLLTHPKAYLKVMAALDNDRVEKYAKKLFPEEVVKNNLQFFTGRQQLVNKNIFDEAKALVGIIANHMSHQGIAKHAGLYFKDYYLGIGATTQSKAVPVTVVENTDNEDISEEIDNVKAPLTLNPQQENAVNKAIDFIANGNSTDFFVIEGKAGTGKTTIAQEIIKQFPNSNVKVAALSHKAKDVIASKFREAEIKASYHSIAGLLGATMDLETGMFNFPENNAFTELPIDDAEIIVIDEASMVNEEILELIMEKKHVNTKVLFLGDIGQLPPIRSLKNPFYANKKELLSKKSPVFDNTNKAALTERVRQGEENPILPFADLFWENSQVSNPAGILGDDIRTNKITENGNLIFANSFDFIKDETIQLFKKSLKDNNPNYIKIVTYKNATKNEYNSIIHHGIFGKNAAEFNVNEPIIFNDAFPNFENSYETSILDVSEIKKDSTGLEYYHIKLLNLNGEEQNVPVLAKSSKEKHSALVSEAFKSAFALKNGNKATYIDALKAAWSLKKKFADVDYAYAITSHKSQGSTYDIVIVDEKDIYSVKPISNKEKSESTYTGLTRARNTSILISSVPVKEEKFSINSLSQGTSISKKKSEARNKPTVVESTQEKLSSSLSNDVTEDGTSIEEVLGMFMNAIVDAAKDPFIARANINMFTASTAFMLTRAGVNPEWTLAFIGHPMLKAYKNATKSAEGRFTDNAQNEKALTKILKSFKNELGVTKEAIDKKGENAAYKDALMEFSLKNAQGIIDISTAELENSHADKDPIIALKVLSTFLEWQGKAKEFNNIINLTKVDVTGAGSEIRDTKLSWNQVLNILATTTIGNVEELVGMRLDENNEVEFLKGEKKRMTGTFYKNSVKSLLDATSTIMINNTLKFNQFMNKSMQKLGYTIPSNDSSYAEVYEAIEEISLAKVKATTNLGLTGQEFRKLLIGEKRDFSKSVEGQQSIFERVLDAQKMYPDNLFLKLLNVDITTSAKLGSIKIPNTNILSTLKDSIISDYEKLHIENKELAEDLAKYSFYSSMFNTGVGTFHSLIPPSIIDSLGIANEIENVIDNLNNDTPMGVEYFDTAVKHLYSDNRIVPKIKLAKNENIKPLATEVNGNKVALPVSVGFGLVYNDSLGSNYVAGVDTDGNILFKPYLKVETQVGTPTEPVIETFLYRIAGYKENGVAYYLRTNKLGYNSKGTKVFEVYSESNSNSIIRTNFVLAEEALKAFNLENAYVQELPTPVGMFNKKELDTTMTPEEQVKYQEQTKLCLL
jgi:exodeoxyribonuclease-5